MNGDLQSQILSKGEIADVLAYLKHRQRIRHAGTRRNLIIFRLSCCCGMRRGEISALNIGDLFVRSDRPFIRIRKEATKRCKRNGDDEATGRARKIPLSLDAGTLKDLTAWLERRKKQTDDLTAPFVCAQRKGAEGKRLTPELVSELWRSAIKVLGKERVKELNVHAGRHTCISHLLWSKVPLTFVRDFAGHANISTTSRYLHLCDMDELPKNVFA